MLKSKEIYLSKLLEPIKDSNKISVDVLADMVAFHVPSGITNVIQDVHLYDKQYHAILAAFEDSDPIIVISKINL